MRATGTQPPIVEKRRPDKAPFAFKAPSWSSSIHKVIELTQVFRQSDREFVSLLNRVRCGQQTDADLLVLRETTGNRSSRSTDGIGHGASAIAVERPTLLFSNNKQVDGMNARELASLRGEVHRFRVEDEGSTESKKLLKTYDSSKQARSIF